MIPACLVAGADDTFSAIAYVGARFVESFQTERAIFVGSPNSCPLMRPPCALCAQAMVPGVAATTPWPMRWYCPRPSACDHQWGNSIPLHLGRNARNLPPPPTWLLGRKLWCRKPCRCQEPCRCRKPCRCREPRRCRKPCGCWKSRRCRKPWRCRRPCRFRNSPVGAGSRAGAEEAL